MNATIELQFQFQAACLRVQQAFERAEHQGRINGMRAYEDAVAAWQCACMTRDRLAYHIVESEHPELCCLPGMVTAVAA